MTEASRKELFFLSAFLLSPLSKVFKDQLPLQKATELLASGMHGGIHSHDTCVWLFPVKIISYSIMEKNREAQPDSQSHGGKMRGVVQVQNVQLAVEED